MAAQPQIETSVVCDCVAGSLSVTLHLMAADGAPTSFEVTNPHTHETATPVVAPGEETPLTLHLPLADDWIIPVSVLGVSYEILVENCCLDYPRPVVGLGPDALVAPTEIGGQGDALAPVGLGAPLDIRGFVSCKPGDTLGDGSDLRVLLMSRGAGAVVAELLPISGSFTRELDATSSLSMKGVVGGRLAEVCCDGWQDIRPWATEILVFRDGRDVWAGPVTDVVFNYGGVSIEADDLTAWWDRRVLPDLSYSGVDMGVIFQGIHTAAMAPDPSPNIILSVENTGIIGTRSVRANTYTYASDVLHELAKTDLDFTAYGRTVLVRGAELDAAPFLTFFDEHWTEPPSVHQRGNEQATVVVVRGTGVQSVAVAPANYLDYYGYLVRTFDESTIQDQGTCDRAAASRLDLLKDPLYIDTPSGAHLKTSAPITLPQLIPGMRIRVDTQSTCFKVVADFRLKKVSVDFNGNVSIDLQPIGTLAESLGVG